MANIKISMIYILQIILLLTIVSRSKDLSQKISMSTFRRDNAWRYMGRMHLNPGSMDIDATVSFNAKAEENGSYQLEIIAIPSQEWNLAHSTKCNYDTLQQQDTIKLQQSQIIIPFHLDLINQYSYSAKSTIEISKDQTYNFVVRHCQKSLMDVYGRDVYINVQLHIGNNNKLTSSTQHAYGWSLPLLILVYVSMVLFLLREKQDQGDNWIKLCLKYSLYLGGSSIIIKYFGFIIYSFTGAQYQFFDFTKLLLHSASDGILVVLIVLLAYGWTVTFITSTDFDIYVPLACMLGFVNIIMTLLTKINDGDHDKHHTYDSVPAYVLIGFRILGFLIFLGGSIKSIVQTKAQQQKTKKYFQQLCVLGTIYILIIPLAIYIVEFVDSKYRKQAMFFGLEFIRVILNAWLCFLSGSKKSSYRNLINKSFMQKGQKFL